MNKKEVPVGEILEDVSAALDGYGLKYDINIKDENGGKRIIIDIRKNGTENVANDLVYLENYQDILRHIRGRIRFIAIKLLNKI